VHHLSDFGYGFTGKEAAGQSASWSGVMSIRAGVTFADLMLMTGKKKSKETPFISQMNGAHFTHKLLLIALAGYYVERHKFSQSIQGEHSDHNGPDESCHDLPPSIGISRTQPLNIDAQAHRTDGI